MINILHKENYNDIKTLYLIFYIHFCISSRKSINYQTTMSDYTRANIYKNLTSINN